MNAHTVPRTYRVVQLLLDSGERLPSLVDATTLFPARVATRWAIRYRRYRVQSSTLAGDLRILGKVYTWASLQGIDLDLFLTSGQMLTARQIEALALYLRGADQSQVLRRLPEYEPLISNASFDYHLSIARRFFTWSMDHLFVGTSERFATIEQVVAARMHTELIFQSLHTGTRSAQRILPLTPLNAAEIAAIREAIGPLPSAHNAWHFPEQGFSQTTCLRNWLMFETALGLPVVC